MKRDALGFGGVRKSQCMDDDHHHPKMLVQCMRQYESDDQEGDERRYRTGIYLSNHGLFRTVGRWRPSFTRFNNVDPSTVG